MSKERARRRAEREAVAARSAQIQALRRDRAARRRARTARLRALVPKPVRNRRQRGILAQRRRAQNTAVLGVFLLVQGLAWLLLETWTARLAAFALSVFLVPVVVTIVFDRRSQP